MKCSKQLVTKPSMVTRGVSGLVLATTASVAFAHHMMDGNTPQTFAQGLLSGLAHPIIGLDHLAFLIVAMLLACALKGTGRYIAPLVFVAASIGGTAIHLGATHIPMGEALVALTVLVGATLVVLRRYPDALALSLLFGISGVLHGYAYGESIVGAEPTPLVAYLIGFAAIQYALIVGGILGLDRLARKSESAHALVARFGGVLTLLAGGLFLALRLA